MKTIVLIALLAMPCFGRVGETENQCLERYGAPVEVDKINRIAKFKVGEMTITVVFERGLSVAEVYKSTNMSFNDPERRAIMSIFGPWHLLREKDGNKLYANDGGSKTLIEVGSDEIIVSTSRYTNKATREYDSMLKGL